MLFINIALRRSVKTDAANQPSHRDICQASVPKEQPKIARRFNAGSNAKTHQVPQGRPKLVTPNAFIRPFGTRFGSYAISALKRRAILVVSLRDNAQNYLINIF